YHLTRDRTAADDVTQEAFLRVFRAIGSYRGEHQFASWLLRIVRNCVTDSYQRIKRDRLLRERVAGASPEESARPSGVEDRLRIEAAASTLAPSLREPFVLIDMLGYSYRETSEILGVKIGTLKSRLHRAHGALVRALTEH